MLKKSSAATTLELELWADAQNQKSKQPQQNGMPKNGGESRMEFKRRLDRECHKRLRDKRRQENPEAVRAYKRQQYYKYKTKYRERQKEYYNRTKQQRITCARKSTLKLRFGLTPDQYFSMIQNQSGLCGICNKPMRRPCIDHSHETLKVRAILCQACNVGLGHVEKDGGQWLALALEYLKKHS